MMNKGYNINTKAVKKRLIDMELSMAEIARRLNVHRSVISLVISNKKKSKRVYDYLKKIGALDSSIEEASNQ